MGLHLMLHHLQSEVMQKNWLQRHLAEAKSGCCMVLCMQFSVYLAAQLLGGVLQVHVPACQALRGLPAEHHQRQDPLCQTQSE